jgi:hypothetical protein
MQQRNPFSCFCLAWSLFGVACTPHASEARQPVAQSAHATTSVASASSQPAPLPSSTPAQDAGVPDTAARAAGARPACPELPSIADPGTPCGELHCLAFHTPAAAFAHVLAQQPRVIGVGESHAQKGDESIPSATRRFSELLLPSLCGRTRAMVLEVWLPRNDCGDQRVKQVERAQKPATATQSKSNQDEYVALGYAAKRLGIEPSALVPTCDEYQSILDAGPDSIERMLILIGTKTADRVIEALHHAPATEPGPVVFAYGGALHNDAEPTPDHQAFSYGPRLLAETQGHYIELDLIVREFVKDTELWKKQPYYRALRDNSLQEDRTLLYQWGEHSYGLVFGTSAHDRG